MPIATMTSKGQVTIPKQVRDALDLEPGAKLAFKIVDQRIEIEPAVDLLALRGILKPKVRGVTVEQMNRDIEASAVEEADIEE